jgi:FkbM family methyltransferase
MKIESLKHLNPQNILDIGANVGGFFNEAKKIWPHASFTLIEGNPKCEPYLQNTGQKYHIALLSDEEKTVNFYVMKNTDTATGNSYYKELTEFYKDPDIVPMKTARLDSLITQDENFDFIKIDVQGAEHDVIKGGTQIFKKANYILMEVAVTQYNERAPLWDETIKFMNELGFDKYTIIDDIVHPINRNVIQKDLLFYR